MEQHDEARPTTLADRLDPETVARLWAKVGDAREEPAPRR